MDALPKIEIDRLAELASVGAGHAAGAFAQLVGQTIRMEVPVIIEGGWEASLSDPSPGDRADRQSTGVFFQFEGCLDAIVGILFPGVASEALVRKIVGIESGELALPVVESALMEVGNILASHVASAIADTLGSRLLPSIPSLAMENAEEALISFVEASVGSCGLRIESTFSDETGLLRGRLILIPTSGPLVGRCSESMRSDSDDV